MPLNPKDTWYVMVRRSPEGTRTTTHSRSKTFQTEAEAKRFARLKIAEDRSVNAGTINPFSPRRTIAAAEIHRWLEAEA
jgi:hypothetical protein